jgi:hypothetical protein
MKSWPLSRQQARLVIAAYREEMEDRFDGRDARFAVNWRSNRRSNAVKSA